MNRLANLSSRNNLLIAYTELHHSSQKDMQMHCRTETNVQLKVRISTSMAIVAIAVLALSGCSNSSKSSEPDSLDMNNSTDMSNSADNSAELIDPTGAIASLSFLSAEDDAQYQCLLSAAAASARSRGLQAYPVLDEINPILEPGVYATWCKTIKSGDAVNADIEACQQHLRNGQDVSAAGTEALRLFANIQNGPEKRVNWFQLKSIKIPTQSSNDFKVDFTIQKQSEIDVDWFGVTFVPFDGDSYNEDAGVFIASAYTHVDQDVGLRAFYTPNETAKERKSLFASSAAQLEAIATADYQALKAEVAKELNADSSLDTSTRQAALDKATTEFDRVISMIGQHSEAFHRLLLEQLAIEDCG